MKVLQLSAEGMNSEKNLNYIFLGRLYLFLGGIGDPLITGMLEWVNEGQFEVCPDRYWIMGMCFLGFGFSFLKKMNQQQKLFLFDLIYFCFSIYEIKTVYDGGFSGAYQAANMIVISLIYTVLRSPFLLWLYTLTIIGVTSFFLLISFDFSISQSIKIGGVTSFICLINLGVWKWRLKELAQTYKTKSLFQGIFDVSQNGMVVLVGQRNPMGQIDDFRISHFNQASILQFPFLKDLPEPKSLKALIPVELGVEWIDQLTNVIQTGESFIQEEYYVMPGGKKHWIVFLVSKLEDGLVVTIKDISDQRSHEQQLEEAKKMAEAGSRAKSDFLATMSHEIRTPMNGITGMVDLLDNTVLTKEQEEHLEIIRTSSDNLLVTINDILDFSKIESGKLELEERDFSIRNCLETILESNGGLAREKHLDLFYFMESNVPEYIKGDEVRLGQILGNLVGNGIKFTNAGDIFVHVQVVKEQETLSTEKVSLQFTIRDTGIGIPADKIPTLFKAFQQADTSNTRQFGGSGLGLAICYRLCEIMGGRIWVESKVGEGSCFQFTLPFERGRMKGKYAPVLMTEDLSALMGKRVLIVDDNAINLMILEAFTAELGLEAELCSSPSDAIEWAQNRPYDLIITDFNMPEMDGLELAETLRKKLSVPILLLSSSQELPIKKLRNIVDQYHFKPIKKKQLKEIILELFKVNKEGLVQKEKAEREPLKADLALEIPIRILLAEDYIVNQKIAVRMFHKLGYDIDIVDNGRQAVERLEDSHYDLIFMDVQMPEMDGLEATRIIRRRLRHNSPMIIAMTANAMPEDREKCLAAGMDDYLSKPFKPHELQQVIEKYRPILNGV